MNKNNNQTKNRLTASVIAIVILSICLCITTYALVMVTVSEQNNYFQTGAVKINLNDGRAVIEEHEFLFEPGMTVNKEFFIENLSTWDVYYMIYFEDVQGGLADVLQVTIRDGNQVLFEGTPETLSRANVNVADDTLHINERRVLTISFHYPEEKGNETQNMTLSFDFCADAVQTKNNPKKIFD